MLEKFKPVVISVGLAQNEHVPKSPCMTDLYEPLHDGPLGKLKW